MFVVGCLTITLLQVCNLVIAKLPQIEPL